MISPMSAYIEGWRQVADVPPCRTLQAGDTVIVMGEANCVARRATVSRITHTGKIVVDGRHYDPDSGNAVTRRGWLELYTARRWANICAAAQQIAENRQPWRAQ